MALNVEATMKSYGVQEHNEIVYALRTLKALGFFRAALKVNTEGVIQNFNNGDPVQLAQEIIEIQTLNRTLLSLEQAADELQERKYQ